MQNGSRGRLAVAATALAIVAGLYGAGHQLGRATGSAGGAGAQTAREEPAGTGPEVGAAEVSAGGNGAAAPPGGQPPVGLPPAGPPVAGVPPRVAVQPVTGPGRPPLPMIGSGPHGTLRTTGAGFVALTFDDGPDPRWTPEVLARLREHRVKATFCVVGQLVEAHPELVRAIAADGHTLCNHSWSHDVGLGNRSRAAIRADLERTNAAIRAVAPGPRVSYYRQPGGAWTKRVVQVAAELGMSSLHWAVDPQDWSRPGAGAIAKAVASDTGAGEIVLLHDGGGERRDTVRALDRFLADLAERYWVDALPPGVDPPRHHGRELPLKPGQV